MWKKSLPISKTIIPWVQCNSFMINIIFFECRFHSMNYFWPNRIPSNYLQLIQINHNNLRSTKNIQTIINNTYKLGTDIKIKFNNIFTLSKLEKFQFCRFILTIFPFTYIHFLFFISIHFINYFTFQLGSDCWGWCWCVLELNG